MGVFSSHLEDADKIFGDDESGLKSEERKEAIFFLFLLMEIKRLHSRAFWKPFPVHHYYTLWYVFIPEIIVSERISCVTAQALIPPN